MDLIESYPRRLALFLVMTVGLLVALRAPISYLSGWRAEQEIMANRRDRALSQYRRALALVPNDSQMLMSAGYVYASSGDTTNAVRYYRQVLDYYPGSTEAMYFIALAEQRSQELTPAAEVLREAVRTDGSEKRTWLLLATVYRRQGRTADAVATWREIARRFPENRIEADDNIRSLEGTAR